MGAYAKATALVFIDASATTEDVDTIQVGDMVVDNLGNVTELLEWGKKEQGPEFAIVTDTGATFTVSSGTQLMTVVNSQEKWKRIDEIAAGTVLRSVSATGTKSTRTIVGLSYVVAGSADLWGGPLLDSGKYITFNGVPVQ